MLRARAALDGGHRQGDGTRAEGAARYGGGPARSVRIVRRHASGGGASQQDELPNIPDWDEVQRLQHEKDVLGFYVSGHPLGKYAEKLRNLKGVVDTQTALEMTPAPNTGRRTRRMKMKFRLPEY